MQKFEFVNSIKKRCTLYKELKYDSITFGTFYYNYKQNLSLIIFKIPLYSTKMRIQQIRFLQIYMIEIVHNSSHPTGYKIHKGTDGRMKGKLHPWQ